MVHLSGCSAVSCHLTVYTKFRTPSIAQAHGLSLSQLYRVFQSQRSTVGDHIRQRRLDRIKYELTSPASRHFTIAALARKWGFLDTPHFNRVFKAQYKITPQQLQHQVICNRKSQIDK
ncbi:helix-turn-helix transcriptional regulator [Limnohabitans sp.]|uniref:helix-turn-helix transcriptional regulator n=1 Tax=Limnohabitans sp. TaxID=1907725 RepID=UPI0037BFA134